jgi:uncharacterized protein
MERADWNLLVLAAAQGRSLTPAQFQKALFLLQKRHPQAISSGYLFRPYNYGPFSADVYRDAERLEEQALVSINRSQGGWRVYRATPAGLEKANQLLAEADPLAADYVRRVVEWARSLSFQDLIKSVYAEFPEMKAHSIFQDEQ